MSIVNTQTSMKVSGEDWCKAHPHKFRKYGDGEMCVNCLKSPEEIREAESEMIRAGRHGDRS